jgi:hypothetical protein
LCDILHLEGRKISKNKYGGRQPKKFENPCLKPIILNSIFSRFLILEFKIFNDQKNGLPKVYLCNKKGNDVLTKNCFIPLASVVFTTFEFLRLDCR